MRWEPSAAGTHLRLTPRMHHIYNMADEKDNPCAGMAETPDASRAATAAAYVCRGSDHGAGQHAGTVEIDRQAQRLSEWAKISGAVVSPDYFTGLERISTTTAEHEVFFRPADDRYIKRTYPGTFGVTPETKGRQKAASPAFYLQRISAFNRIFDGDIKFEGVTHGKSLILGQHGDQPSIVISQGAIRPADVRNPHPNETQIADFMRALGFEPLPGSYYGWERAADGVCVLDARLDNFILSKDGPVPIDLVVSIDNPASA